MKPESICVIGAGLSGCEAAWQAAQRGINVKLFEMKPYKKTPAHHIDTFAELVCSNSLRSDKLENAVGLLKEELRILGSLIIEAADNCRVPAGGALAVDRNRFSEYVTKKIKEHPNIEIIHKEIIDLEIDKIYIIATGPLTSETFSKYLKGIVGNYLYFFDAAAPIIAFESIDMTKAFKLSRYGKGGADYINCPMSQENYLLFWNELIKAEVAEIKDFEKHSVFEGCMPIEVMAKRGIDTLRFGPLKPVGLPDPNTGEEPYAVVQLRQDNKEGTLFNMVGFQTHLKWGEQKRVFRMVPGLEKAEFVRYGVMHRNTYINSPSLLDDTYRMKSEPNLFFAGQITGVEGYVESTSSGLVAGINAANLAAGRLPQIFPKTTAIGALAKYISQGSIKDFQPMNINFGIIESLGEKVRNKKERNTLIAKRALAEIRAILQ